MLTVDRRIALIEQLIALLAELRRELIPAAPREAPSPGIGRRYNSIGPRLRAVCGRPQGASQAEVDAIANWATSISRSHLEKIAASRGLRLRVLVPSCNYQMYEPAAKAPAAASLAGAALDA